LRRRSAIRWSRPELWPAIALLCIAAPGVARDRGADGDFSRRSSSHFILYQDVAIDESGGLYGSRRFEQDVLKVLEAAYDQLDHLLGLRPRSMIQVVIYDPGVFDATFAGRFRFAAAGFYHGVIRIRGATAVDTKLVRVLHHELVHAALDAAAPSYVAPGWLNEGLAEWFEVRTLGKRDLNRWEWHTLRQAQRQGALLSVATLSRPAFGAMGPDAARLAYLQSYGMVEYLARNHGERSLREFCLSVVRGRDLARSLRRVYRIDLATLERRFLEGLG
jgi:hypothetical protein